MVLKEPKVLRVDKDSKEQLVLRELKGLKGLKEDKGFKEE